MSKGVKDEKKRWTSAHCFGWKASFHTCSEFPSSSSWKRERGTSSASGKAEGGKARLPGPSAEGYPLLRWGRGGPQFAKVDYFRERRPKAKDPLQGVRAYKGTTQSEPRGSSLLKKEVGFWVVLVQGRDHQEEKRKKEEKRLWR